MPPAGIEPTYTASKAVVLSVERQGQIKKLKTQMSKVKANESLRDNFLNKS